MLAKDRLDVVACPLRVEVIRRGPGRATVHDHGRRIAPWTLDDRATAGAHIEEVDAEFVLLAGSQGVFESILQRGGL